MSNSDQKVFVKFVPKDTTEDELRRFFSACGTVAKIKVTSPKAFSFPKSNYIYMFGFITYETKTGADRAIEELNGKVMVNSKGYSNKLFVEQHIEMASEERQHFKEQEKDVTTSKEYQELLQTWKANEEKINQIYNRKDEEEEMDKLRERLSQLEAKKSELKKINDTLIQGNSLLRLQVKIKNLEAENMKLKELKEGQ